MSSSSATAVAGTAVAGGAAGAAAGAGVDGAAGGDEVLQDAVDGILVEDAEIAVGVDVHLQGFEFEAVLVRHVGDADRAEVGQAGLGADGGVLRHLDDAEACSCRINTVYVAVGENSFE